jgi:aryl-alcohol dehydrogenase-like predicted oxidoreductase
MKTRHLGRSKVSAIGMGGMPLSTDRSDRPSEDEGIRTILAALEAEVTLFDTADVYAPSFDEIGHNERLIAKALKEWDGDRDCIVVATKGGITWDQDGQGRDASPEHLRQAVEASLRALDVDVIDLYQWHRPDRWRIYGEVIATLKELKEEGKIKEIGISNANIEEIQIAIQVLGPGELASVQNRFSPDNRCSQDELDFCERNYVSFLPWSPLGGIGRASKEIGSRYEVFAQIGQAHHVSPQQVVLAWELSLGKRVIPIPGASRPESIIDSALAADLELTPAELAACSAGVPAPA